MGCPPCSSNTFSHVQRGRAEGAGLAPSARPAPSGSGREGFACLWLGKLLDSFARQMGMALKRKFCDPRRLAEGFLSVCFVLKPPSFSLQDGYLGSRGRRASGLWTASLFCASSRCSVEGLGLNGRGLKGGWWLVAAESQGLRGPSRPGCRAGLM